MKLLKNADLYCPEHLGKKDVLIEGTKIVKIEGSITEYDNIKDVEIFDLKGKKLVPGYIDLHEHITGGGGEQGPSSRTPEASLSTLLKCGITTVVGLLGTDGITRSIENLLAKCRAFNDEGITCYMLTSAYGYPPVTLLGSVEKDIIIIKEIIGVKVAASDHRSSNPTGDDLIALGTAARRAGLLSNCAGLVTIHMGSGKKGLTPLFKALDESDIPPRNFLPTHMNTRGDKLIEEGVALTKMGGTMDYTAGANPKENETVANQVKFALDKGLRLEGLTCSTDGYGSMPRFNEVGECIGLTYQAPTGLHELVQKLVEKKVLPLENALTIVTSNPAYVLDKVGTKGSIQVGSDADMLVYDNDFNIESVISLGKLAIWENKQIIKGKFEI